MNEILATSSIEFLQSISLTSLILFSVAVFLGTYVASRLYGFLGVCYYVIAILLISLVESVLFL